ncbi:MAG: SDR family NAD(P)-dependent oxidoreductase, partial [Gammaproteobacteria bacterium]|nr:SDR family NAD(P)-dependent oxidoreductase [Gammaproteobacteria bacterium]
MKSLWQESEASKCKDELDMRVYTSRLLGSDPALVLHGGGNTSVKIRETDITGKEQDILYVKGSGWDLATIERPGFAPVKMDHLLALAKLDSLSDPQMVNELKTHVTVASAPTPSVEAILHAILPFKFVDHTHADSIVTVTNTPGGKEKIKEIYGDSVVVVDYIMPGFDLARQCARQFAEEAHEKTVGMVLLNHGIFSFADTAKESYELMIELVTRAEDYIKSKNAWVVSENVQQVEVSPIRKELAQVRRDVSKAAGKSMLLCSDRSSKAMEFIARGDISKISQQGPATPDHVIRTKRLPMLGRDVDKYVKDYKAFFDKNSKNTKEPVTMLDPAPRVILDPELGLLGVGTSANDANIVLELYDHTIDVISRASKLGEFCALPAKDIFDVEYWDLEQAKLRKGGRPPEFAGEVALVTGAASGIGKACCEALLAKGAAVIGMDISPDVETVFDRADFIGVVGDVGDEEQVINALEIGVRAFGGLDMLVLNAGIFPGGCALSELDLKTWRKVMSINLDGNVALLR